MNEVCPTCGIPTLPDLLRKTRWCSLCYKPAFGECPPQLSGSDILMLVEAVVSIEGTQKAAAQKLGISTQYLNDILRGRRDISAKVSKYFGLERVVIYIPTTEAQP